MTNPLSPFVFVKRVERGVYDAWHDGRMLGVVRRARIANTWIAETDGTTLVSTSRERAAHALAEAPRTGRPRRNRPAPG